MNLMRISALGIATVLLAGLPVATLASHEPFIARPTALTLPAPSPGSNVPAGNPWVCPGATSSSDPAHPVTVRHLATPLAVAGNQIVDAHGNRVVLGGVHRAGYTVSNGDQMGAVEADALACYSSMVRIEISDNLADSRCTTFRPDWLDSVVHALTARGVVALLDLHLSSKTACGSTDRLPLPGPGATAFWDAVAARFSANPLVAFELWNEPHCITASEWRNGGTLLPDPAMPSCAKARTGYTGVGMQALYDTVAAKGRNLIFVDGMGYAGDPTPIRSLTEDARRTVWAEHIYGCSDASKSSCEPGTDVLNPSAAGVKAWDAVGQTDPVVITETGYPDPSDSSWQASVAAWAGAHRTGSVTTPWGVIGFADDGTWNGSVYAITDSSSGWAPNAAGRPLATYLLKVAPKS